ncbi:MAG: transposase [Methyloglobulus sp.]|nr:transposase [Methyloglobulus sp.]
MPVPKGHKWRVLPGSFPPWQTVYDHWQQWNWRGVWEGILDDLKNRYHCHSLKN